MKRSSSSAASCSSSPSSSSSCSEIQNPDKKRPRRNPKSQKQKPSSPTPSSANGGRRSSIYRGVTRHRWTGRFEAHLWDKSSWNSLQSKKGRQVYLGAYDNEEAAARTYDLAALKYWGRDSTLNFSIETYSKELEEMENVTKEEYLASLRRQSSGFSRGVSKYRGVARHHHNGRWEARIGRVLGNKYLYLGTYNTQEEAAAAYDLAAIEYRGTNAVTNFDISNYIDKIKKKTEQSQEEQTVITITEADPNSSSFESSEVDDHIIEPTPPENLQNQLQQNPEQQEQVDPEEPLVQSTQVLPPSEESSPIAVMDNLFEQDLPWSFMEDYGFSSFEIPDFASGDLLNMFDGALGFEDDLDFLIRPEPEESEFNLNAILNSPSYEDLMGAAATTIMVGEDDGPEKLPCSATSYPPSSSPSSSISSNYTL